MNIIKEKIKVKNIKKSLTKVLGYNPCEQREMESFYVLYTDKTFEYCYGKDDLIKKIEKKYKTIECIFDTTDKYSLNKEIEVEVVE